MGLLAVSAFSVFVVLPLVVFFCANPTFLCEDLMFFDNKNAVFFFGGGGENVAISAS